jgi:chromosomal replication initiation ATPase DnaA
LGSSDFVERVLKQADEELEQKYRLRAAGVDFEKLLMKVAQYYEIDPEDIKTASKESAITRARRLLCYLAVRKLMISCADVARALNISLATVSRAVARAGKLSNLEQIQKKVLNS